MRLVRSLIGSSLDSTHWTVFEIWGASNFDPHFEKHKDGFRPIGQESWHVGWKGKRQGVGIVLTDFRYPKVRVDPSIGFRNNRVWSFRNDRNGDRKKRDPSRSYKSKSRTNSRPRQGVKKMVRSINSRQEKFWTSPTTRNTFVLENRDSKKIESKIPQSPFEWKSIDQCRMLRWRILDIS